MKFHELRPNPDARKGSRRLGRGFGSGRGKTAGKGTKGQLARPGGGKQAPFSGGAFPLTRTTPYKKGFKNKFRVEFHPIAVGRLNDAFEEGATVTIERLQEIGLLTRHEKKPVKILSDGEISKRLTVQVHRASAQARAKIEAAGGTVEEILPRKNAAEAPATDGEA